VRSLSKPKKLKKILDFAVFDIESANWTNFLVAGVYDGTNYSHFYSVENLLDYCFSRGFRHVFAHFGGIFDFLFLLQSCLENSERFRFSDIVPRGSGILQFKIHLLDRSITFHDSSALLPFSLKEITETFGVANKKQEFDVSRITKVTPKLLEYLEYDCKGLWQSLRAFFDSEILSDCSHKFTIAGQAIEKFKTFLTEKIPACPFYADEFIRKSYAGGRVEIFKPLFDSENQKLKCYDVNSLYPFCMLEDMPTQFEEWSFDLDLNRMGFIKCVVEVPDDTKIPILWVKTKKFIFPTGILEGTWSTLELREAIKHGAKILKVKTCCYFRNGGPIFKDYVESLFERRKNSKNEVEKTIIKLLLNSTYGRMGIDLDKEGIELDNGQENVIPHFEVMAKGNIFRFVKTKNRLKTFSNVAIASWITSIARVHLHRILVQNQNSLYYCDTDSIFTTNELETSNELGALKLEYETSQACFLLPKVYLTHNKIRMKGFDKKKIKNFKFEDFEKCLEGSIRLSVTSEIKMARFKTALKKGNSFLYKQNAGNKTIKAIYDKRKLIRSELGEWETIPLINNL